MRWLLALLLFTHAHADAETAAETARAIREGTFDRGECYRVRDLTVTRHEVRIFLTDGYLMFSKPVAGRRLAAVFSAEVEGGDGEVIVMPPSKGERRSLAIYAGAPNLNEHFKAALFLGTDDFYGEIMAGMKDNPANRKMPEMAPVLDEEWGPVLRNLSSSYETRLTFDIVGGYPAAHGLLAGFFSGARLGNFDVVFDPRAPERIMVGQVVNRENRSFFNTWTSFEPRNRPRTAAAFGSEATLRNYRIDATVAPDLTLSATTRVKVKATQNGTRVLPLDIARNMTVESATVDGRPAEVLQRDALRANLGRGGNELFLVMPHEPLQAGREYEFEFRHSGKVIHDAGDRVFYVTARGNWYPTNGLEFATYDLNFRYPRDLDLVGAGEVVEDTISGEWRTTRRRTSEPIRTAAFNMGIYQHARVKSGPYSVEVYANRSLEKALQPRTRETVIIPMPQVGRNRRQPDLPPMPQPDPPPSPTARLQTIATEVGGALEFMAGKFGPPTLPLLTVSPIPGTFGQGFPGLIYLSTLSYLKSIPGHTAMNSQQELFYGEILQAHETAHQWWGNVVCASGYHDYWLMEALANYSALLFLEKQKGAKALEQVLELYRNDLQAKNESGQTVESTGPIVLGTRLETSVEPRAWRVITYYKGSWIMHMLRRIMGDERFFSMLAQMRNRYERKEVTTEEFRALAASFLPPKFADPKLEAFFDQWVYGTGIPALKLSYSIKGKAPAQRLVGTVTQSDVQEEFAALVPIEIQLARGKNMVHWVRASNEPVEFTVPLKQPPLKVSLDPHASVLRK